jgi:hypothetical protein
MGARAKEIRTIRDWLAERRLSLRELCQRVSIESRVAEAICDARYTPSPAQRQALAKELGVEVDQIAWGHVNAVEHVYGHGPQFGRSP